MSIVASGLIGDMQQMFPQTYLSKRKRKGLIDVIGSGISYVTGLSTERELNIVKIAMKKTAESAAETRMIVAHETAELRSFVQVTSQRMENFNNFLINASALMHATVAAQETIMDELRYVRGIIVNASHHRTTFNELIIHLQETKTGLERLAMGELSRSIIKSEILRSALEEIDRKLGENNTGLQLVHKNPFWYYAKAKINAIQHDNTVYIIVSASLTTSDLNKIFGFYKVNSLFIPTGETLHMTKLRDVAKFVAFADMKPQSLLFQFDTEPHCENNHIYSLKTLDTAPQRFAENSCMAALLTDKPNLVSDVCLYDLHITSLKTELRVLNDTHNMVINSSKIQMECYGPDGSFNKTEVEPCHAICVIETSCGCGLTTEFLRMPPHRREGCNSLKSQAKLTYATNLMYLFEFFKKEQLEGLRGSTLLKIKPDIAWPKIKMFPEANGSKYLAIDRKLSFELKHLAEKVRQNMTVFTSLEEQLIGKNTEFWNTDSVEDDNSIWSATKFYIPFGSGGLATLSLILSLYLLIRVKMLANTIVLLGAAHRANGAVSHLHFVLDYYGNEKSIGLNGSNQSILEPLLESQIILTDYVNSQTLIICSMYVFGLMSAIIIAWSFYRKQRRVFAVLELYNGKSAIRVPLFKLPADMNCYMLVGSGERSPNIRLSGQCFQKLIILWQNTHLVDYFRDQKFKLSKTISVNFLTAKRIRSLLASKNFGALIVIQQGQHERVLTPMKIKTEQPTEPTAPVFESKGTTGEEKSVKMYPTLQLDACYSNINQAYEPEVNAVSNVFDLGP